MERLLYHIVDFAKKTVYRREHQLAVRLHAVAEFAQGRVLEVGATEYPNEYLPPGTTMLDITEPMTSLPQNYSDFVRGTATELSKIFGLEIFDSIVASEVIEHIPDYCSFLSEAFLCLKPGGRHVLTSPNPFHIFTIVGNLFYPSGLSKNCAWKGLESVQGPYFGHIHLHIPRIVNVVATIIGFEIEEIRYIFGFGRLFSGTILYVYIKRGKSFSNSNGS